jgi:DNA-binding sugar fermentation-stimulating protein
MLRQFIDCTHQEGQVFVICFSTGDFLKVIITANLFVASFTDCSTSRGSAHYVMLAERRADAYRSTSKKMILYITHFIVAQYKT